MKPPRIAERAGPGSPRVLVVDDDRRVLELLEIAFAAHGFRVITACEGEEAIQRTLSERPDLLVLDVRLPKKSGLEVCEALRRDPEEYLVPIILVSAAGETDARLLGLASGADDYMAKPFSPKELIARSKRLLARTAEGREARRRTTELERELHRVQGEAQRAHADARREQRLRELTFDLSRDLHPLLDLDEVARRTLLDMQARLGVGMAALLLPEPPRGAFVARAVRGDGLERFAGLAIEPAGPLVTILNGLGRAATCRELERLGELRAELPALIAGGIARIAPLPSPHGLEGLLVTDERIDGMEFARAEIEMFAAQCEVAARALHNATAFSAQVDRQIELLISAAREHHEDAAARAEAWALVERAARTTLLPPRQRELLGHAVALGVWGLSCDSRSTLEHLEHGDPTRRLRDLRRLCDAAAHPKGEDDEAPEDRRAAILLTLALEFAQARHGGAGLDQALGIAIGRAGAASDPATVQALEAAVREAVWMEGTAA